MKRLHSKTHINDDRPDLSRKCETNFNGKIKDRIYRTYAIKRLGGISWFFMILSKDFGFDF